MIWGLITSLFSGLSVDLKVYRKEVDNDVRTYGGYSGAVELIKPEFLQTVTDTLQRVNGKLIQANSATLTLLLLIIMLAVWMAFGHWTLIKMTRRMRSTAMDVEASQKGVATLEDKVEDISQEKAEVDMLERTRRMISSMTTQALPKPWRAGPVEYHPDGTEVIALNQVQPVRANNRQNHTGATTSHTYRGEQSFSEASGS